MVPQHFHSDDDEGKPPRIMFQPKKIVNGSDEQHVKMGMVVILATEGIEYEAICAHLNNPGEGSHQRMMYAYGTFYADKQEWDVRIIEIGMGGDPAALIAKRAINYFHPNVVLLISTACGIQGIQPGDIVSATKVYAYEANESGATFQTGSAIWNVNGSMGQWARAGAERLSWLQRIKGNVPATTPRVVLAPVASGKEESTSTHSQALALLHTYYEDTIAIEMGGYRIVQAAQACQGVDTLVICGIAETVQEQSTHGEDGHRVAAEHASAFAFEVLASLESKTPSQPAQKTEAVRPSEPAKSDKANKSIEVFYSYVDSDEALVKRLQQHLVTLKRAGHISNWDVSKIPAGGNLRKHLEHLETARLILLLLSPGYLSSEHHYKVELKRALEKGEAGDASVVPILLRPTRGLDYVGFDGVQIIPRNGKAITQARNQDQAFEEIAYEIEEIVKALKGNG